MLYLLPSGLVPMTSTFQMCIRDSITADYRTMIETPEKLVGGMKIILRLFDNAKGIFGVEDNKPECIETVSYTHLDVYKRQPSDNPTPIDYSPTKLYNENIV